ncbi:nucleoside diphosphate-linked moiety x motif 8 [Plakobranchus ocellatus]|uniref:Nucleoside diphosphate-linked moiety x motif 8 n=1 Tax=Plakobranchus ocellatus TaxID=259542 RepID=A0AAV3Z847_9GAST|nr:nucleoside diphosphate-linked moiety x motif 8 [Plakobranchus ocellatus]
MICTTHFSQHACKLLSCKLFAKSARLTCCVKHSTFETLLSEENKLRTQQLLKDPTLYKQVPLNSGRSYAAILVPLCTVKGEPSLLYTLRSTRLTKHKGQVSFPGGNVDEKDPDIVFTALRETQEELGIHPSRFEIWGRMRPLPTGSSHKIVEPVVARLTGGDLDVSKLRLSPDEVEEAFTVSLKHLCNSANIGATRFRSDTSKPYTTPVFLGAPHRIWGFTAIVTHILLTFLAPDLYKFKVVHKKAVHHRHRHQASRGKIENDS